MTVNSFRTKSLSSKDDITLNTPKSPRTGLFLAVKTVGLMANCQVATSDGALILRHYVRRRLPNRLR